MKNYRIYIHAVKSTAKMIGALGLSEEARRLELICAEDGVVSRDEHEKLLEDYKGIVRAIQAELDKMGEGTDKTKEDESTGVIEFEIVSDEGIIEYKSVP